MSKLNAYLNLQGKTRAAMTFYKECLGGKLEISTVGDSPMAAQAPAETKNNVMHSSLTTGSWVLMGADMMSGDTQKPGNVINLCLMFDTKEEAMTVFKKLSAGGKISMPIKAEFFGTYGAFTDKFGVPWAIQSDDK